MARSAHASLKRLLWTIVVVAKERRKGCEPMEKPQFVRVRGSSCFLSLVASESHDQWEMSNAE